MSIQLEVGKRYVLRNGDVTDSLRESPNKIYPFTDNQRTWTEHGAFWADRVGFNLDIISEYKEETPMSIKLEVGKRYVMRNGGVTNPISDFDDFNYPFADGSLCWTSDGKWMINGGESSADIISEYVEPKPKFINDEFVRGWLDGRAIQFQMGDGSEWLDIPIVGEFDDIPYFTSHVKYRFKPKTIKRTMDAKVCLTEENGVRSVSPYTGLREGVRVLSMKDVTFEWTEEQQ